MSQLWTQTPGSFPWAPMNGQIESPMFTGAVDIRWDDPSIIATGSTMPVTTATGTITILGTPDVGDVVTFAIFDLVADTTRTVGGKNFDISGSTTAIAASLSAAINDRQNLLSFITSTSSGNTILVSATKPGYDGNAILLSTSSAYVSLPSSLQGGIGDGAINDGKNNSSWTIVGVNVYRSDTGERGPYIRLNKFPIGSLFYRDMNEHLYIKDEIVQWDNAWISKGDTLNDRMWTFCTIFCPVVKPVLNDRRLKPIPANSPYDVTVSVDGEIVMVDDVYGPNGEITLVNVATYDPVTEKYIQPKIPNENSEVLVSYYYNRNKIDTTLDQSTQFCYKLTTVAMDSTSPTGYKETPLSWTPPLFLSHVETIDYIWREAIKRNMYILEQAGERVKLFKRKVSGIPCNCRKDERTIELYKQPSNRCELCYGSGFIGGFDGPFDIIIAPDDSERRITQTPQGRRMEHTYEVWTGPSPTITQRDFLVKQTGERYSIGALHRPAWRGTPLQQHFTIGYLDEGDIRYLVPINGIEDLLSPKTRYMTNGDPYPVGSEYQSTPMVTEKPSIPEQRQERGRTVTWENNNY